MLYDKRWDKPEVKADPFSLESLIAWLEKMPADGAYRWEEHRDCLLGQWCIYNGLIGSALGNKSIDLGLSTNPDGFYEIAVESGPYTFGAALERARQALAARS